MLQTRLLPLYRVLAMAVIASGAFSLTGCGAFFQCEGKTSCGTSGTGTGTGSNGDYAYVSNSATGSTYLNEYSLSSGALTAIAGSPTNLGFVPVAMAVAPGNPYVYIGQGDGHIYEYTIGTNGALTVANSGQAVVQAPTGFSSMDVSPDGKWLFALDNAGLTLYEFPVTVSSGLLGTYTGFDISAAGTTVTPQAVRVSPNGNYVACALGTAGTIVFPYSSSTGIGVVTYAQLQTGSAASGDYGLVLDSNNVLYIARTTGPAVYTLSSPSANNISYSLVTQSSSLTNGSGPHAIALSSSAGAAVYVGNFTDSTITGYTSASGKLTNLSTVAYTGPTSVSSLARDNTGKYVLAAGYNGSSGIQLFTVGSTGALSSTASAASGTSTLIPALIAVTR